MYPIVLALAGAVALFWGLAHRPQQTQPGTGVTPGTPSSDSPTVLVPTGPSTPKPNPTPTPTTNPTPTPTSSVEPVKTTPTPPPTPSVVVKPRVLTYEVSSELFPNPERGFRSGAQLGHGIGNAGLAGFGARGFFDMGQRVLQGYISLQNYKNKPIDDTYLNQIRSRLDEVRKSGLKVVVRFWYSWGPDGASAEPDAPMSVIRGHVAQLAPILKEYADCIMVLQSGFFGAWGEWHSSREGNLTDANKRELVKLLLEALPSSRRVSLRHPDDIKRLFWGQVPSVRLAHHNDCFMVNQSDAGTYPWNNPERDALRNWLASVAPLIAVGGEMCGDVKRAGGDPYQRDTAAGTLAELERFCWTWVNDGSFGYAQQWKDWKIYDTIKASFGYRLQLDQVELPDTLQGFLRGRILLKNVGYAAPINPRLVRVVLRQGSQVFTVNQDVDVLSWVAKKTHTIDLSGQLPAGMPKGKYEVLLHLADPFLNLTNRPEHSIQLASTGVWEPNTGFNKLSSIIVS